uniref:Bestrophin homolog n=1 Tax=Heterorhabditis bacteriophora TaxID=37862 RepID=A0A1I7WMX7_HETBA
MTISYSGNFCRLLLRWKGSLWRSVWKELLIYLALFYAIRLFYIVGINYIDDNEDDRRNYRLVHYRRMFEALCRMFDGYTKLIPLTFLLGFYVSNVVARWWRQFECLSWPEDILSILCTVIHQTDETSQKRRHTIARYLNLSAALAWRDISSKIRMRFPTVASLISAGLLTQNEYDILERINVGKTTIYFSYNFFIYVQDECETLRWMTPLHWIQQIMRKEEEVAALATYAFFFFTLFGRQCLIPDIEARKEVDLILPIFTIVQFMFFVGWFKVRLKYSMYESITRFELLHDSSQLKEHRPKLLSYIYVGSDDDANVNCMELYRNKKHINW